MICRYTHCRHKSAEIELGEPFEKVRKCYYHRDCNEERVKLNNIVACFVTKVNDKVSVPELRKIVNSLVHDQGFDADYVEFALGYALEHPEYRLTYPPGLYRICRSKDVAAAWKKKQDEEFKRKLDSGSFVAGEKEAKKLTRKKTVTGFRRILGGI